MTAPGTVSADELRKLADELARLPYLPETGGDAHLNRIIPALRAAASALEARERVVEAAAQLLETEASVPDDRNKRIVSRGRLRALSDALLALDVTPEPRRAALGTVAGDTT